MSYCFGIDIGGTTVKCGLFTTEGVLLEKWEIKTRTEENGKAILPDVAETILKKMEEKELLNKIKIYTVEDLLNYYPYRYDIIKRSDLSNLSDGDKIIIDGIVEGQPTTIYINKSLKMK